MNTRKPDPQAGKTNAAQPVRAARLAEALRANLLKRKAQSRARRGGAEDQREDGILAPEGKDDA